MNFSFGFSGSKQKESVNSSARLLAEALESYKKAIQESTAQYNEHRKKAEEQIGRGARLTKHRIDL